MIQGTKKTGVGLLKPHCTQWDALTCTSESINGIPQKDHNPAKVPHGLHWALKTLMQSCCYGFNISSALTSVNICLWVHKCSKDWK